MKSEPQFPAPMNAGDTNGHGHLSHRERLRKARRLSLSTDDAAPPSPSPCTDFDVAYFHSYAHLGIHEEMIKVLLYSNLFHLFIN